jgi:hypothetical protein
MIRKSFTPIHEPNCKRNFCGICGTHLTYWSEVPEPEADYLNVTVGSLFGEDLRTLDDLGLLSNDAEEYDVVERHPRKEPNEASTGAQVEKSDSNMQRSVRRGVEGDIAWMEEMIDGSRLGRSQKTKRGMGRSADGTMNVDWEVTEIVDEGSEIETGAGRGKRKLGDIARGS